MPLSPRTRKRLRWVIRGGSALFGIVGLALFLAAQRKPTWYAPAALDTQQRREARADATNLVDEISRLMVKGEPFVFSLSAARVTTWLGAVDIEEFITSEDEAVRLARPAVALPGGERLAIGLEVARSGLRAVLSVEMRCALTEDGDELVVRIDSIRLGAIAIPRSQAMKILAPVREELEAGLRADPDGFGARMEEGDGESLALIRVSNDFVWPNGERRFRIRSIDATESAVSFGIVPD